MEKRPIYLSRFSLGANVVAKCLGELGSESCTTYNIYGAAVTGASFNAKRNVQCLDATGFNRAIYSNNFLKTLKKRARFQLDRHCDIDPFTSAFNFPRVMSATSIAELDNAFIARIFWFENNMDYYRKNLRYYFLKRVAVPLFIINTGDDPFFDPENQNQYAYLRGGHNWRLRFPKAQNWVRLSCINVTNIIYILFEFDSIIFVLLDYGDTVSSNNILSPHWLLTVAMTITLTKAFTFRTEKRVRATILIFRTASPRWIAGYSSRLLGTLSKKSTTSLYFDFICGKSKGRRCNSNSEYRNGTGKHPDSSRRCG